MPPRESQANKSKEKKQELTPIVGVGASAGGLEAFKQLLGALPEDTGMAFVLISHLGHSQKSMLSQLLSRATQMRVEQVGEATEVHPNVVYVIPPNRYLQISDGFLRTKLLPSADRPPMVIDHFFRSLAEMRKSKAIGVILSGTGTDGTLGLRSIKAEGGITFVQDQASAEYPDMPRSAARSADFELPPEQISEQLSRIASHPYVTEEKVESEVVAKPRDLYTEIFSLLRSSRGIDFSRYKPTTIRRRIDRRMLLHTIAELPQYVKRLRSDPSEVEALCNDLLINVTSFFRDPEVFEMLQQTVLPQILRHSGRDGALRVWVAGCSTGEEAYSIAICLLEATRKAKSIPRIQIFATDTSEEAIQIARAGRYPENIGPDISPERLRRYFAKTEKGYEVRKVVRDSCIFATHDLLKDPPFSRMDLISCRNVLIYFDASAQRRVLAGFHYALNANGFLMLGASESVGTAPGLFVQVDPKQKIYSPVVTAVRPPFEVSPSVGPGTAIRTIGGAHGPGSFDINQVLDRVISEKYAPPGVVVNSQMDIVQFRGRTSLFLEPRSGEAASLNLFKMVRQNLATDLRTALHEASKEKREVIRRVLRAAWEGQERSVAIEVVPLHEPELRADYYLVLFEETTGADGSKAKATASLPGSKSARSRKESESAKLKKDLEATKKHLQTIIEEQEATNEELQSANEEILSSNEELQSMNEELETAKEELQATNEELITVNEELQNRNLELAEANSDLSNLIGSMDIVYLMVGDDLCIRRFTPVAQKVLSLIPSDIGRPINDIKPKLQVENLPRLIASVIDNMTPAQYEIQDSESHWYSMRIRPYKTEDNKIGGAVIALVDIEAMKRTQQALSESEEEWRKLVEAAPDFILNPRGEVLFMNRTAASLAKRAEIGTSIYEFLDREDHQIFKNCLKKVCQAGAASDFVTAGLRPSNGELKYLTRIGPIKSDGEVVAVTLMTQELANGKKNQPGKVKKQRTSPSESK